MISDKIVEETFSVLKTSNTMDHCVFAFIFQCVAGI